MHSGKEWQGPGADRSQTSHLPPQPSAVGVSLPKKETAPSEPIAAAMCPSCPTS